MSESITYCASPLLPDPNDSGRQLFGAYRVELDGFVVLLPHSGFWGTVSQDPASVDDPGFRRALIDLAKRRRREAEGLET